MWSLGRKGKIKENGKQKKEMEKRKVEMKKLESEGKEK